MTVYVIEIVVTLLFLYLTKRRARLVLLLLVWAVPAHAQEALMPPAPKGLFTSIIAAQVFDLATT